MRFKHFKLSLTLILILCSVQAFSQKKYKPSLVTIEFIPSFTQPLPQLYGRMDEFFTFQNYGVTNGFGAHINVKFSANKKGTFKPMLVLGYNILLGTDNHAYIETNYITQYPPPGSKTYKPIAGTSDMYIHDFRAGLGAAYEFVNKRNNWVPYIGMTIDGNVIFGTFRQDPDVTVGGATNERVSYTINSAFRLGFSFGGGVHFRMSKAFGFMLNTNFRYANLFNKKSTSTTEENKMNLLDESEPTLNTNLNKDRSIIYFDFGLGFCFFIGKK